MHHTLSSSLTLELHISHRVLYLSPGQRLVTFAKLFHQGWLWWLPRDCCSPHWTCACLPFRVKWDLAHILGKILYRPPILTQDFGACFIWDRRPHASALLNISSMSGSAFDTRSCNGSRRSAGGNFPIATGSNASNFVNRTTTGTERITRISSRTPRWEGAYHSQDHIHRRTFPRSIGLLDRVCPLGCNTCTKHERNIATRLS